MHKTHVFRLSTLALLLAAGACPGLVSAQTEVLPLPLSGPAYQLAQEAYRASARGDYNQALAQLHEAIRLRPDAMALRRQLRETREQQRARRAGPVARDAGYVDATAAYRAFNARQFDDAVRLARRAVEKTPRNNAYWLLLGNALIESHQYQDAEQTLAAGVTASSDAAPLRRRQLDLRRELAAMQAAAAFKAQQAQDAPAELQAAQRAVDYAPENLSYRLLLTIALLHNDQLQAAEQAAAEAHARDEWQAAPVLLRAYARLRQGHASDAQADFARALVLAHDDERTSVQLMQADAEMAMQRPQQALVVLDGVGGALAMQTRQRAREALARYRHAALAVHTDAAALTPLSARDFPVPALDCNGVSDMDGCRVVPGQLPQDAGFEAAQQAYQAMAEKDYGVATVQAQLAVQRAPGNTDYRLLLLNALVAGQRWEDAEQAATEALRQAPQDGALLAQRGDIRRQLHDDAGAMADDRAALAAGDLPLATEIALLARTGRQAQAREKFLAGRDAGALDDLDDLQLAYLAQQAGEDGTAQAAFERADGAGQLPDSGLQDAAFSAVRNSDDPSAIAWFKRAIDADMPQRSEQQLLDTRRSVSAIDREFGFIASLSRNGGGPSAGNGGQPGASSRDSTWQTGVEAYWRPFGYMNGRTVEVFGRVFQTLRDASGGATGPQTAQATVGVRWKPWSSQNVVVSLGRLVPLGSQSSADWLAQLAYSDGIGTELRADRNAWWTTQWYAEAGRYLQNPQTYGLASLQTGRSFRRDDIHPNLVVFPHLTLNADYNSLNSHRTAIGAGPGVSVRYWFREDRYHAPRSYLDLTLQYRFRIGGDDRAQGFFLTTTLSY